MQTTDPLLSGTDPNPPHAPDVCTNVPGLACDGNACKYVLDSRSLSESRIASTMLPGLDTAATCFDNHASLLPDAF